MPVIAVFFVLVLATVFFPNDLLDKSAEPGNNIPFVLDLDESFSLSSENPVSVLGTICASGDFTLVNQGTGEKIPFEKVENDPQLAECRTTQAIPLEKKLASGRWTLKGPKNANIHANMLIFASERTNIYQSVFDSNGFWFSSFFISGFCFLAGMVYSSLLHEKRK